MKRRKFVTAGAFLAALLAAALAAASVGSAATAKTTATVLKPSLKTTTWGGSKGTNQKTANGMVAYHSASAFVPLGKVQPQTLQSVKAAAKRIVGINRPTRKLLPGLKAPSGQAPSGGQAPSPGITGANVPRIHSLPVVTGGGYSAKAYGLSAFWQEATHGFVVTPPDQALAVSGTQTLEAVNDVLVVADNNLNHSLAAEPLEGLFAPAIFATGYDNVSDPRALYDGATGRWFITVVAYDPNVAPGSAVFIAVSNTSDAQGTYNIYVLDTAFDGTTCTFDGCLADQPNTGADRYTLDISTNSFDWDTGAFNGAQLYVIDKTALAMGLLFPVILYSDVAGTSDYPGFVGNTCGSVNPGLSAGFCLASIQPGVTPNQSFVSDRGGTHFMLESLDPLGSVDNRIIDWALTNTVAISGGGPLFLSGVVITSESYGYPLTNNCQIMPQMQYFPNLPFFGAPPPSTAQCGYAEQPASGNTPFCDWFLFLDVGVSGGCEPGAIQANDDRMSPVTVVKSGLSPAAVWGGLNTDALVADPLGVLHRRDAVAWFSVSATAWVGPFIAGAQINGQGYMGNFQNDVLFPSIAVVSTNSASAMIGFSITGNNTNPSVGAIKFNVHTPPAKLPIALPGADVLDDFCNEVPICGFSLTDPNGWYRPRFGDYGGAASWGGDLYVAGETTNASCDDTTFINTGGTCGGTRGFGSNWSTGIVKAHSS